MIRSSLAYEALIAILVGIFVGLFFGPYCSVLKPIGDIFVFVLQIIVLPYIPSLLMHGLGSLSPTLATKLFKKGWFFLVLLWVLVLIVCYVTKILIPVPLPSPATDFSLEKTAAGSDSISLIVPGTHMYEVFNNIVPIMALFSLAFGVAIMYLKEKEPLLGLLEKVNSSLDRIIKWISMISPLGIFAHVAYVMGTVNFQDLAKLQLYIGLVIIATLFLSVWVLPTLVSCLSSIPLRDLFQEYKIVAFLPFATAIPTIALPYINNSMRRLAERKNLDLGTFKNTSQTIIPIGFGFAQIGNFLPLLFIFFLSFYYRHPLTSFQTVLLPFLITTFSIGIPQFTFVALPFLLRTLTLSPEGFNLYAEISAITLNFQVLLSTVSMLSFLYLVMLRYYGLLQINWRRLGLHSTAMIGALFAFVLIGKNFIHTTDNYQDLYYSLSIKHAIENPPSVTVYKERVPPPPTTLPSVLARIINRGVIRVGYDAGGIPFCYHNKEGELVGYDIAYAYKLAKDLDVKLELLPISYDTLIEDVDAGYYDIVMSAILMDEQRIVGMDFSNPYIEQANVLVVPRWNIEKFESLSTVKDNLTLKIGAIGDYRKVVLTHFSQVQLYPDNDIQDLVENKVDAQLWSELPAYIWCLAHPEFTTISYDGAMGKQFFAYPAKLGSQHFIRFVNEWLTLKEQSGFEKKQRQYWFLGKMQNPETQRWSILRDVLHWTP